MSIYQKLVEKVFLPLSLWRSGESDQIRYWKEFERTQYLSLDELRDLQWQRLRPLLQHAYDNCPYYRQRFQAMGIAPEDLRSLDDVTNLPILEKRDIQEHGSEMIASNWPREDLIRNQTGGSTGTPLTFYLSKNRYCSRQGATFRHNHWAGYRPGDSVALIWGAPRDRPPQNGWRTHLRNWLLREPLWLDTAALTEEVLAGFHRALGRIRPRIIQAYARAAVLYAQYLLGNGLRPHQPEAIITSAEVLEEKDRILLEEVFGCPVFNRYGCREVSVIASECTAHDGLHTMAEGLLVEIVTPNGPAAPGEMGSILITDLLNNAMPLIRYRIGDMGSWASGTCSCGRHLPRLQKVAGRVTDFLVGTDGRLVSGVFLATYVVAHRPSLGQVQILQDKAGTVTYRVRPGKEFDTFADVEYLKKTTRTYLGDDTTVDAQLVDALPPEPSGKFLFSRSTVAPSFIRAGSGG